MQGLTAAAAAAAAADADVATLYCGSLVPWGKACSANAMMTYLSSMPLQRT